MPTIRILGPLEVRIAGHEVTVPGRNGPWLLAGLALGLGRPVPEDRLTEWVWGPAGASVGALRTGISRIRTWLRDQMSLPDAIELTAHGYRLNIARVRLDAARFMELTETAVAERDPARRLDLFQQALAEWRAPVLLGAPEGLRACPEAHRLDTAQLTCVMNLADLALVLDRPQEAVDQVVHLAGRHPYDERLHARLITVLGASGRRAQALRWFEATRRRLADELGIDPSPELRDAHAALLAEEARASGQGTARPAVPNMLPPDVTDFTGRERIRQELRRYLCDASRNTVSIAAVSGMGGIGKTALALHLAYEIRAQFPGGQLYMDLHGTGTRTEPVDPTEVLSRFLRILGVGGDSIPPTLDERAELFRTLMSDRRALIILDNATDAAHVMPVLPGSPSCAVIITSRRSLGALAGAWHVDLDVLSPSQATTLLERIVGKERLARDPAAARELPSLCGYLPLALRIAGARLAAKRHWTTTTLVAHLSDERRRLDEFAYGPLHVRAVFALSYQGLEPEEQRAFRRLGLIEVTSFASWAAAALLDVDVPEADRLLETLVDAQLLQVAANDSAGRTRYLFHDLVRLFSREMGEAEDPAQVRKDAVERMLSCLLSVSRGAYSALYGGEHQIVRGSPKRWRLPADYVEELVADPVEWFETERLTIVNAVHLAASAGHEDLSWDLACTTSIFFSLLKYLDDQHTTLETGYAAAERAGDVRGMAAVLQRRGMLHVDKALYDLGTADYDRSLELFQEAGDVHGQGIARTYLAMVDRFVGRFDQAMGRYEQALEELREAGDLGTEAFVLRNIAQIHLDQDRLQLARVNFEAALAIYEPLNTPRGLAQTLYWLGSLDLREKRYGEARDAFTRTLTSARTIGDRVGESLALHGLGESSMRQGLLEEAEAALTQAVDITQSLKSRLIQARVRTSLGELYHVAGRTAEAAAQLETAVEIAKTIGTKPIEERAAELLDEVRSTID
ncbi:tetratricopeptide repeat protein [Nonomuraea sp. K274]|uniref:Tetratricopeptide repeat protein n=1 Tax=Nonomuraea cypriaca TaxID=1187855 RepID=A0A931EXU4_9ACTN|nr:BTAD domain-containing putative transcriptional regulator [Nonomuraea cypriaca]MBF8184551.1 tetratricopeptide repeat protein [Nonomuraea cypriaca]